MKIFLFEILPHKFGAFKYITRDENGSPITLGDNKRKILKDSKYELIKEEHLIGTYELTEIK